MEFEIHLKGFEELQSRFSKAKQIVERELLTLVTRLVIGGEAISKVLVHKKTRHLMRSISHEAVPISGGARGVWGTSVPYGPMLEKGTRAHVIVARTKKALFWKGAAHPVKRVNHPGSRPYPFIKPAFDKVRRLVPQEGSAALKRIITALGG